MSNEKESDKKYFASFVEEEESSSMFLVGIENTYADSWQYVNGYGETITERRQDAIKSYKAMVTERQPWDN